jgi:hypothetical protein
MMTRVEMPHPRGWTERLATVKAPVFWGLAGFAAALMVVFGVVGAPLTTAAAPQGIVSYELAGTVGQAQAILDSWDGHARLVAAFTLGLDYLFMPVYSTAIGLACAWSAARQTRRGRRLAALGAWVVAAQWAAALFDAAENIGLTVMLLHGVAAPWPAVSAVCATIKFALIAAGLAYAMWGGLSARPANPA